MNYYEKKIDILRRIAIEQIKTGYWKLAISTIKGIIGWDKLKKEREEKK